MTIPHLIASAEVGLELDKEPWLLPDTAFPVLEDAYVWRKRVKRRRGNEFLGRLVQEFTQTYANAVNALASSWNNVSSPLSNLPVTPGTVMVTIDTLTFTDDGNGNMLNSSLTIVGAISYVNGTIVVSFSPIGGVGPYSPTVIYSAPPCRSVMGLCTFEQPAINDEGLIAFDTVKANIFNNATGFFNDISFYDTTDIPISWSGSESQFFDYLNFQGAFFATNATPGYQSQQITAITAGSPTIITFAANVIPVGATVFIQNTTGNASASLNNLNFVVTASTGTTITITADTTAGISNVGQVLFLQGSVSNGGDGIRWYANDGQVDGWVNFNPPLNPTNILKGGQILVGYRGRMVILSTIEGDPTVTSDFIVRSNRARWSQNGTVFYSNPVPLNQTFQAISWRDDIPGRGGFVDAPTSQAIIGAEFVRDILIVFFERSTWALRYQGNSAQPFAWSRINTELGSESPFSIVPFDRGVLAVGNRGIVTSDGNNVSRIDLIIPDIVFNFLNANSSTARVHGIRDFFNELVYWTYVDSSSPTVYPNKILVYNYRENSFAIFNDSYTCFGRYQPSVSLLWNTADINWEDADFNWDASSEQSIFETIVAGTNTGYVMTLSQSVTNDTQIAVMEITNDVQAVVTTCGSHNLTNLTFVKLTDVLGMTQINNLNTQIEVLSSTTFRCLNIDSTSFSTYTVSGQITRLNNFNITTKQFNPYVSTGFGVYMRNLDLYTDYIENGQIAINVFVDNNTDTPVNVPLDEGDPQLWQTLFPLDQLTNGLSASKTWTKFSCHTRGQFLTIQFTLNDAQMLDDLINDEEFILHGILLYLGKAGRLISS